MKKLILYGFASILFVNLASLSLLIFENGLEFGGSMFYVSILLFIIFLCVFLYDLYQYQENRK